MQNPPPGERERTVVEAPPIASTCRHQSAAAAIAAICGGPQRERERLSDHTEDVWSVGPNKRERERERERGSDQAEGVNPLAPTVNTAPTRGRQGKLEAFRAVRGVKYTSRTFGGEKYSRLLGNRTTDHPGFHAQCPDH